MRKFVFKKSYGMSYRKQGYIFFCCQNYAKLSPRMQKKVLRICDSVAGELSKALFEAMTSETVPELIAAKHFISTKKMYQLIQEFFKNWDFLKN